MNYKLIMTEGKCEQALINVLIEKNMLIFNKDDLLMNKVFHSRQLDGQIVGFIKMTKSQDTIDIYRVGDKLTDRLKPNAQLMNGKINAVYKVSTLPEFEILFILNDGLYEEFEKHKSTIKASQFYKTKNKKYNKQNDFVTNYFQKMQNDDMLNLFKLYDKKRKGTHRNGILSINDLLRK